MSKPTNKSITYFKAAIIFSIIVGVVVGATLWIVVQSVKQEILVPVVSANATNGKGYIKERKPIEISDLDAQPVSRYNLQPNIVTDPSVLIGKYVSREYNAGEYFWSFNIIDDYPKRLSERIRYGAIAVPTTLIDSCNAEIMEDDFVKLDVIVTKDEDDQNDYETTDINGKLPDSGVTIIEAEELSAVRVVGFCDSDGFDITADKWNNIMAGGEKDSMTSISPSFIIFDGDPIQQALILQGMYGGKIKIIIVPEEQQEAKRLEWGLVDEDGNSINSPNFVDNTKTIEEKQEQLRQSIEEAQQAENEEIDGVIQKIENGEIDTTTEDDTSSLQTIDPITTQSPAEQPSN